MWTTKYLQGMSVFTNIKVSGVSTALTARVTETHTANPRVSCLLLLSQYWSGLKFSHG